MENFEEKKNYHTYYSIDGDILFPDKPETHPGEREDKGKHGSIYAVLVVILFHLHFNWEQKKFPLILEVLAEKLCSDKSAIFVLWAEQ